MAAATTLVLACGCSSGTGSSPARHSAATRADAAVTGCRHQYASSCFTPQQLRVAYGVQPLLNRGTDGRGQTVVLMEFANSPPQPPSPQITDIRQDLALFDAVFALPAARLRVDTTLAGSTWPWLAGQEEVEDAEIVHAIAPDAAIRVILIPPWTGPGSWIAAVDGVLRLALSQGSVVSLSAILGEECFTPAEAAGTPRQAPRTRRPQVAGSATCLPDRPTSIASQGSGRAAACPTWPETPRAGPA